MPRNDRTPAELRFYEIRFDVSRDFNLDAFKGAPEGPRPVGFTCRAVCTPDVATYICSATATIYIEPLDYDPTWPEGYEPTEDQIDFWHNELSGVDIDPDYYQMSNFCKHGEDGSVTFSCPAHLLGTEVCTGPAAPDEIREYAQGNQHI